MIQYQQELSCIRILLEYCRFVEKVKENVVEKVDEPVRKAIEYCIENHILETFLRKRGQEVLKGMTIDMTFERRIELATRDAYSDGIKEGIKAVVLDNLEEGKSEEQVINKIVKRFDIAEAKAKEYYDMFSTGE